MKKTAFSVPLMLLYYLRDIVECLIRHLLFSKASQKPSLHQTWLIPSLLLPLWPSPTRLCQPPSSSHSKSGHSKTIPTQEAGLEGGQHAERLLREWCVFLQQCILPLWNHHFITLTTLGRLFSKKPTLLKILAKPTCHDDARSPCLLYQHNSGSFPKIIQFSLLTVFTKCVLGTT